MIPSVRLIPDGAEVVLSEGEPFAIHPQPVREAPIMRGAELAPKAMAVEYRGFQNVGRWREYRLVVGRGAEASRYTVSIELAAFAERQALLQDGPDICYQKLLRELRGPEQPVPFALAVTEAELAAYRAAHSTPGRSSLSAARTAARTPATP
jgi:hypothetical protein